MPLPTVALAQSPANTHVPFAVDANGKLRVSLPAAVYSGQKTVTTAGTRVPLATSQTLTSGVYIKALARNTCDIFVGPATVAAATGFVLAAGDLVYIEIADLATVYIDAAEDGDGVSYLAS